ncbi:MULTISPECIES: hypothetical protein [Myxococcus]|uniref:Uncharacterized protein n=1 Tax=Myxococcus llanfairpwllgwyngyllgogerychwyrndrobwllllantysiliogogogochensis TaxID=2590453 RepID=A0A540X5K9_9BACT|nr:MULTISPECIES: hypothetical protein [Myxococcus]NTX06483.1 hypothetical protein [Myxococcus sp. CA040A]TQF16502.1 hypothetical protein FJV41_07845 [Myxococcus llanfairpwllgwyngyllgogerychwyrndrobwllllantysiliogogogochensis]
MSRSKDRGADFTREFEGAQTLDGLLEVSGSPCDTAEVLARMQAAHAEGRPHSDVIPGLFEEEPRFPSPDIARLLYQNLLGLWDLVEEGRAVRLEDGPRPPRPKKVKAPLPQAFHPDEPTGEFVEAAWRYLEDDEKARTRLMHSFENRQDALLGALDAAGLTDEGYGVARHLLFELYAMLELGWSPGVASVRPAALVADTTAPPVPQSLRTYADEALFEAEQDEEQPLTAQELEAVRTLVRSGLAALWGARKGR